MTRFVVHRLLSLIPISFVILTLVFLMTFLIPGDAAIFMAGFGASEAQINTLRQQLGLSDPLLTQYLRFIGKVLQGDLGRSLYTRQSVADVVLRSFPNSWLLASVAMGLSIALGIPIGVVSAVKRSSLLDRVSTLFVLFGYSMPGFWLGLMLILLFSLYLGWFPPAGAGGIQHLILPAIALASNTVAIIARMTRSSFLEVLSQDYIRTARSKGISEIAVTRRHVLRNSLIAVATVGGLEFSRLVGRSVVIEAVFAWPGVGRLLLNSILARDIPLVEGIVLVFAITVVIVNLVVDLGYMWMDPRIEYV